MKDVIKIFSIFGFFGVFLCFPAYMASADIFDLSLRLTEGGYKLELTPDDHHKGLTISVNTDVNTQYEVVHSLITPLENRDNPGEVIRDNFVVRGLSATNRFGNLRIPSNDSPVRFDEILYVSNSTGSADSFTLIYGIINSEEISPGYYYGKIAFTLRPIGSSRQPKTEILDVYLNIREDQSRQAIEIVPVDSLRTVVLSTRTQEKNSAGVSVKIDGNFYKLFSLTQLLTRPLESKEGNQLDPDAINFMVSGISKGMGVNQPLALSTRQQAVYTSTPSGGFDNNLLIIYSLADSAEQKAGNYSSRIQYMLDKVGLGQRVMGTLDLEVEIERIFDIMITPEDQKGTLDFPNLHPKEPPRVNEVLIEVDSNTGRRYQVSQNVYSNLTDKEGNEIPSEYFKLQTFSIDTKGKLKAVAKEEVKKGDRALLVSDSKGSPDKFRVVYELTSPMNIKAGDYSTRITYSLSEL
ncbi:MAG: hypothetical protein ABIG56_05650 [Candidatus Omnitrophota bacterium]